MSGSAKSDVSTMDKHTGLSANCDGGHILGGREERAQFIVNKCQSEHDFHQAFTLLYADQHIRLTTEADMDKADMAADYYEHLVQRFVDTSLTEQQVAAMKTPTLLEGVLFKDLVLALFALEQQMFFVFEQHKDPWPSQQKKEMELPPSHSACACFVIDDSSNRGWPHLLGRYYVTSMVSEHFPGFFEVDIRKNTATWHEISEAHVMEVGLSTLRPSPGGDTESYTFDIVKQEPSTGMFVCLSEGLCAWNRMEQRYDLVFPISALRSLLDWCEDQVFGTEIEDVEVVRRV
jgi:hypothetical protein